MGKQGKSNLKKRENLAWKRGKIHPQIWESLTKKKSGKSTPKIWEWDEQNSSHSIELGTPPLKPILAPELHSNGNEGMSGLRKSGNFRAREIWGCQGSGASSHWKSGMLGSRSMSHWKSRNFGAPELHPSGNVRALKPRSAGNLGKSGATSLWKSGSFRAPEIGECQGSRNVRALEI